MSNPIIYCTKLSKSYYEGRNIAVKVLQEIDLSIQAGDRIAIIGPSGSGKSTLLHLLGGLDTSSEGQVLFQGVDWQALPEKKRCQLRNKSLGFIYQFHHLLPEFSAHENVAMPLLLAAVPLATAYKKAKDMLTLVGLDHRLLHKPAQLSGGERQRVAIARALVHSPQCVFADEPTGNLDQSTASTVFAQMLHLNAHLKTALVIVTHDMHLAEQMDTVIHLDHGVLRKS